MEKGDGAPAAERKDVGDDVENSEECNPFIEERLDKSGGGDTIPKRGYP
jgi:hypothetical protein